MPPKANAGDKKRKLFKRNGRPAAGAPRWTRTRYNMTDAFPLYYATAADNFRADVNSALIKLEGMKHPKEDCPVIFGADPSGPDYSEVTEATLPEEGANLATVVDEMLELFDGLANSAHPLHQSNVLPNANKASLIAGILANYTSQNFIEGENAWNLSKAEMETAAMISRLIHDWSVTSAGGIFTYGGAGCYLYAVKYALASVLEKQNSRCTGVRVDGKIFCSQQGHYAKMNATDWLGIGMDNIVDIETDDETNVMDLVDLQDKLRDCTENGIPVLVIICTMGTTDAFAIDPVKSVADLIEQYPNPAGYGKTLIYCDSAIGWSFLTFRNYNFPENPLQFSDTVLAKIQETYDRISEVRYADAVALDFHKTGWTPYATSMFLVRDLPRFKNLMNRPGSAYLHARTPYNPGLYSLEVSRSAAPALSAWASLRYFGATGYQSILAGVLEVSQYLRGLLKDEPSMICVNEDSYGFVTLLRVYPEGVDAETQYQKELSDPSEATKTELKYHNELQENISKQFWWWLRSGSKIDGLYGPYASFTSGFRTTDYNDDLGDKSGVIYALKSYPMNVNITTATMDDLMSCYRIARERALNDEPTDLEVPEIGPPYDQGTEVPVCGSDEPARTHITNMLSGVVGSRKKKLGRGIPRLRR